MEPSSKGGLPPWCRKAALSLGTAAVVVTFAYHRLKRQGRVGAKAAAVLVVVPSGDTVAGAAAKSAALGNAEIVSPSELGQVVGDRDSVAIFCSDVKHLELDMDFLLQCLEKLVPGGLVTARLGGITKEAAAGLENTGLFAGALEPEVVHHEGRADNLPVEFSCKKPSWSPGAAALPGTVARINEDDLLGEVPKPVGKGKSDCSSAPKACANCSCGRKELEDKFGAEEAKKRLEQGKERSSCGSCYLGDAFRCESCPYRGLPAFKEGTKVELSSGETEGAVLLGLAAGETSMQTADGKLLISAA